MPSAASQKGNPDQTDASGKALTRKEARDRKGIKAIPPSAQRTDRAAFIIREAGNANTKASRTILSEARPLLPKPAARTKRMSPAPMYSFDEKHFRIRDVRNRNNAPQADAASEIICKSQSGAETVNGESQAGIPQPGI